MPPHLVGTDVADSILATATATATATQAAPLSQSRPLPRETGKDIGMGSPVPLSAEAVEVITRLRNMKVGI